MPNPIAGFNSRYRARASETAGDNSQQADKRVSGAMERGYADRVFSQHGTASEVYWAIAAVMLAALGGLVGIWLEWW